MATSFVGQYLYDDYCRRVRYGDPELTVEKLTEICNFLDGKKCDDNGKIIKNVLDDFIYQIVRKPYYDPEYPSEIEEFIKSDYFSDKIKKDILKMTKSLDGYERINKMLKSKLNLNDFDLDALNDISDAFFEYSERKEIDKDVNIKTPIIFNKYMFVLDGSGPVLFIINNNTQEELAKEFLTNVGLFPEPEYYKNMGLNRLELNEDHLISIYKEYEKYLPEKKDDYVSLVKANKSFSPFDFITNYNKFVKNGFSTKSLNLSKDNKEPTDASYWHSKSEDLLNDDIKNMFIKYINKDKKLKKTI